MTATKNSKESNTTCTQTPTGITGTSLAQIMDERSQKPEVRKAIKRSGCLGCVEEAKGASQESKKTAMAAADQTSKKTAVVVVPVKVSTP